jgi:hypothetical protein
MSVRYVAFGAAGRAVNGCRDGQFDECAVVVGGHHNQRTILACTMFSGANLQNADQTVGIVPPSMA